MKTIFSLPRFSINSTSELKVKSFLSLTFKCSGLIPTKCLVFSNLILLNLIYKPNNFNVFSDITFSSSISNIFIFGVPIN